MKKRLLTGIVLLLFHTAVFALPSLPTAKVTLKVIDEKGDAIEGAKAGLIFYIGKQRSSTRVASDSGLTDSNGLFSGGGESPQHVRYSVNKIGYYHTNGEIRMKSISSSLFSKQWQPWNPTIEVILKKIENPIAMYAYNMDNLTKTLPELPVLNRFIGYDLIARDWVIPHGLGTHRDFLFKLEKHYVNDYKNYSITFTVAFENEGDGVQSYYAPIRGGSSLRMPHHAPATGYKSKLVINRARTTAEILSGKSREDQNYYFRVRTERDDKGNVTSALYGKIYGSIGSVGVLDDTGKVRFNYYLNPTPNDTNIEFDPDSNLFKDLSVNERVSKP